MALTQKYTLTQKCPLHENDPDTKITLGQKIAETKKDPRYKNAPTQKRPWTKMTPDTNLITDSKITLTQNGPIQKGTKPKTSQGMF